MIPGSRALLVMIASENTLLRECLAERIGAEPGFQVSSAGAADAKRLTAQLKRESPDVLLLDAESLGVTPHGLLVRLRSRWPRLKILTLTSRADELATARALRSGALGVLSKTEGVSTLFRALTAVASGESWAGREAMARALTGFHARPSPRALTPRERQLLGLLGDGYRNKELASILKIKEQTVKVHLHSLFRKLNVRTRVEAALRASELS